MCVIAVWFVKCFELVMSCTPDVKTHLSKSGCSVICVSHMQQQLMRVCVRACVCAFVRVFVRLGVCARVRVCVCVSP